MPRIFVYDSGVGNIPIAEAINSELPNAELFLVSDTAFFPYGEKEDSALIQRALVVLENTISELMPDVLVLGCNTLSTIALEVIRKRFNMPVVGVVPAIKPAALKSKSKVIGLIATPATIHRAYTNNLISDYASDCDIIRVGSTELVHMAEGKVTGKDIDCEQLRKILQPFLRAKETKSLDQLVLGCTHFPILRDEIAHYLTDVEIQDSSAAIGKQVSRRVSELRNNVATSSSWQHFSINVKGQLTSFS